MVGLALAASPLPTLSLPTAASPRAGVVVPSPAGESGEVVLRVSGQKPIRMRARLLAEATSWSLSSQAWNEIALYRRDGNETAVAIKTFKKSQHEPDVFHAELFPTFDEAVQWLERFDPAGDIEVGLDASDRSISAAEVALRAASLRNRSDDIVRRYRALVGELLFRLDQAR